MRNRWVVSLADVDAWLDAGQPSRPEPEVARYAPFPRAMSRTVDAA
jgi:hypothetical protein